MRHKPEPSKRLSPFSTEKSVYAAIGFQGSARFPQVWIALWILLYFPLLTAGLALRHGDSPRPHIHPKHCTFRTSPVVTPVEKRPSSGYNDAGVPTRTVPVDSRGYRRPVTAQDSSLSRRQAASSPEDALAPGDPPLIAVYTEPNSPPQVVTVADQTLTADSLPQLIEAIAVRAHGLAQDQGGRLPLGVFRELVANLVHASFADVIVTILDAGNTVRVSDRGPGILDKQAALRPGFTSADAAVRRFIRGVGSGFSVVTEMLNGMGGTLEIEDNLGTGTVVTARVPRESNNSLTPNSLPAYNLPERQLKTLLLTVELAPVGPTRVAQELGVSTSTAYRDLVSLEDAGYVTSGDSGHRSVTDQGLVYLTSVL
jgi:anti-sigma regulatory factor (Ser/Thr protein kinase)